MSKSILQGDKKKCFFTGCNYNLDCHHIYPGPNRKVSEKYGFKVWVWHELHNGKDPKAIHNNPNKGLDLFLKKKCQKTYERMGHSREEFIQLIGRSYL
jgi:hypothetical protein